MNALLPFPFDRSWSLGQAVELACLLEVSAAKIGNVHPGASFRDMSWLHFIASATAIAPIFQQAQLASVSQPPVDGPTSRATDSHHDRASQSSPVEQIVGVGRLVLDSVLATRKAAGCNTNLGMLLLFAPIAQAHLLRTPTSRPLQPFVAQALQQLSPLDSQHVYLAIRQAAPGGLGEQAHSDVADPAPADLIAAMQQVAQVDAVARQYTNDFEDIFGQMVPWLREELTKTAQPLEAICRVHLRWLADQPDGLIIRKAGTEMALHVQHRAASIVEECLANPEPLFEQPAIRELDQFLREDGHRRNPGTTADLIAASVLVLLLE